MTTAARRLSDFLGSWDLDRRIVQSDGQTARFIGQASWVHQGDGALYSETGQLTLDGQPPMRAERRYRWGADLSVWFEDGRFFHHVPPQGGQTGHWCDPDQYEVAYGFDDWPRFHVTWQVRGPRKDYTMTSLYNPLSPAER